MVHCCVLGCVNRSERKCENITFHTFPKADDTRNKWIAFTGRKQWKPSKYDRMCSKHFESYCFYKTKFKVYLRNYAVPTLCKHRVANSVQCRYSRYKNNEPTLEQTNTITLQVPGYNTTPSNDKEVIRKVYQSPRSKKSAADFISNNRDDGDEETDDAITDASDKDDDIEITFDPTSFPVQTPLPVKDEVIEPEEELSHSIEVTVECDVEDSDQNNTKDDDSINNITNTPPATKEPKGPYSWGGNYKGRPSNIPIVKEIKPLIEKYTSDEELDSQEKNLNSNVLEKENNDIDKVKDQIQEEDLEYFQWKPLKGWQGTKKSFLNKSTGPTSVFTSPYASFRAFWDNGILSYIATETNKYADIQNMTDSDNWMETNVDEILILFAFWIMLGIIKMPTIKACYAHNVSILRTDVFRRLLSENRYMKLIRSFYIVDRSKDPNDPDDLLYHFRTLIDHLNSKFKDFYNLEQDICIDETSNLWKTNCPLGIKIRHLCESKTGYIWSFLVDSNRKNISGLPDVVYIMKLLQPLLHLGHTLYTDSWFSTPILARYLKQKFVNFVGTLRNFKDIPPIIKNAALDDGEYVARQCGDLMAIAFNGGKRQCYLSNYHDICQINDPDAEGPRKQKLKVIDDYERGLRKIHRMDFCTEPYLEQTNKWQFKLFKILLNMTIHNARILLEKSTNIKIDSLGFRLSLVQTIIERHLKSLLQKEITSNFPAERLTARHFIRQISTPGEEFGTKINNMCSIRKACVWCKQNGRDSKTTFECPDCNVALCLDICFEEFHTVSG